MGTTFNMGGGGLEAEEGRFPSFSSRPNFPPQNIEQKANVQQCSSLVLSSRQEGNSP
jgi:hypothetical protein